MSYSQFIGKCNAAGITLNRKALADLALNHPEAFKAIVMEVKDATPVSRPDNEPRATRLRETAPAAPEKTSKPKVEKVAAQAAPTVVAEVVAETEVVAEEKPKAKKKKAEDTESTEA